MLSARDFEIPAKSQNNKSVGVKTYGN